MVPNQKERSKFSSRFLPSSKSSNKNEKLSRKDEEKNDIKLTRINGRGPEEEGSKEGEGVFICEM